MFIFSLGVLCALATATGNHDFLSNYVSDPAHSGVMAWLISPGNPGKAFLAVWDLGQNPSVPRLSELFSVPKGNFMFNPYNIDVTTSTVFAVAVQPSRVIVYSFDYSKNRITYQIARHDVPTVDLFLVGSMFWSTSSRLLFIAGGLGEQQNEIWAFSPSSGLFLWSSASARPGYEMHIQKLTVDDNRGLIWAIGFEWKVGDPINVGERYFLRWDMKSKQFTQIAYFRSISSMNGWPSVWMPYGPIPDFLIYVDSQHESVVFCNMSTVNATGSAPILTVSNNPKLFSWMRMGAYYPINKTIFFVPDPQSYISYPGNCLVSLATGNSSTCYPSGQIVWPCPPNAGVCFPTPGGFDSHASFTYGKSK